jgi:hypothetical protein
MKYLLCILLFCTQLVFAETVPFDGMFWNETQQLNYEGSDFMVGEHQSAGHLQKHRMFNVLNENPYLHYTTFPVGDFTSFRLFFYFVFLSRQDSF